MHFRIFFNAFGQQNILNTATWASVDWCLEVGHEQLVVF
jgi:hypothetical protein